MTDLAAGAIPGVVLKAAQGYLKNSQRLDKEDAWLENLSRMSWFGSGGMYRIDGEEGRMVVSGIYNPAVIEKLCMWEEEGRKALILEERGELEEKFKEKGEELEESIQRDEEMGKVWKGENIFEMDIETLSKIILDLEEEYKEIMKVSLDLEGLLDTGGKWGNSL